MAFRDKVRFIGNRIERRFWVPLPSLVVLNLEASPGEAWNRELRN